MRDRFPLSSFVWQVPHFAITSGSVTGMPSSGFTSAAGAVCGLAGACDCTDATANKTTREAKPASFFIILLCLELPDAGRQKALIGEIRTSRENSPPNLGGEFAPDDFRLILP